MKITETAQTVRLSPAAQAILKQQTVTIDSNATSNIVHAVRFR